MSLETRVDGEQPVVIVYAASAAGQVPNPASKRVHITHDGSGADARLVALLTSLSSTSSLQEVLVVGVDATTGSPITGRAVAPTIALEGESVEILGTTLILEVDERFSSLEEADAFALRVLRERTASRISAEVLTDGIPDIAVGGLIELQGIGTKFDGSYVVTRVEHRLGSDSNGGYSTVLRVRRADLGMFFLPSVDAEVLVAFDHGDVSKPLFFGSWWGCDSLPERSDDDTLCRLLRWPW